MLLPSKNGELNDKSLTSCNFFPETLFFVWFEDVLSEISHSEAWVIRRIVWIDVKLVLQLKPEDLRISWTSCDDYKGCLYAKVKRKEKVLSVNLCCVHVWTQFTRFTFVLWIWIHLRPCGHCSGESEDIVWHPRGLFFCVHPQDIFPPWRVMYWTICGVSDSSFFFRPIWRLPIGTNEAVKRTTPNNVWLEWFSPATPQKNAFPSVNFQAEVKKGPKCTYNTINFGKSMWTHLLCSFFLIFLFTKTIIQNLSWPSGRTYIAKKSPSSLLSQFLTMMLARRKNAGECLWRGNKKGWDMEPTNRKTVEWFITRMSWF